MAVASSAHLNTRARIEWVNPQVALIAVAPADREGLPLPETLEALEGYNLLCTDVNRWIEITTEGKQMWVEVEKK